MTAQQIVLMQEHAADYWDIEGLFDLCFGPGRTILSSYRLRDGVAPVANLCLTAHDAEGTLAGAVRNWPVLVGGQPVVLLGPVAVHPTRQGEGIAALLMWRCIELAAKDWDRVMLVGDAPYYSRFGFEKLENVIMPPPTNPDRVLGIALKDGAWDGVTGEVTQWRD